MGGVSSGGSFALKLIKEMEGEIAGAFSEVLAIDPDKESDYDVRQSVIQLLCVGCGCASSCLLFGPPRTPRLQCKAARALARACSAR